MRKWIIAKTQSSHNLKEQKTSTHLLDQNGHFKYWLLKCWLKRREHKKMDQSILVHKEFKEAETLNADGNFVNKTKPWQENMLTAHTHTQVNVWTLNLNTLFFMILIWQMYISDCFFHFAKTKNNRNHFQTPSVTFLKTFSHYDIKQVCLNLGWTWAWIQTKTHLV